MTTLYQLLILTDHFVYDSPLLLHKSVYDYPLPIISIGCTFYMTVLYYPSTLCKAILYQLLITVEPLERCLGASILALARCLVAFGVR